MALAAAAVALRTQDQRVLEGLPRHDVLGFDVLLQQVTQRNTGVSALLDLLWRLCRGDGKKSALWQ